MGFCLPLLPLPPRPLPPLQSSLMAPSAKLVRGSDVSHNLTDAAEGPGSHLQPAIMTGGQLYQAVAARTQARTHSHTSPVPSPVTHLTQWAIDCAMR